MKIAPSLQLILVATAPLLLAACVTTRAQTASTAQATMVGMSKEAVLACMGTPERSMAEGLTEVWTYGSGGETHSFATGSSGTYGSGSATTTAQATGNLITAQTTANARTNTSSSAFGITQRRYCDVHIVLKDGRVQAVNYSGRTGGLLTQGEQCAYAVENCVPK